MEPTPGCWARDVMGAAFAGVFWGVLVTGKLVLVMSMAAVGVRLVIVLRKFRADRNLRGREVRLLVADWLRHLGGSLTS
jgi:hypothetical protein